MTRHLVLAVEVPDDVDLSDLGEAIARSFERAVDPGVGRQTEGRVRVDTISQALGGWQIVDVDGSAVASDPWPTSGLVDEVTVGHLSNGSVEFTNIGGADPDDPEATPVESFGVVTLPADGARTIGLALAAWTLR